MPFHFQCHHPYHNNQIFNNQQLLFKKAEMKTRGDKAPKQKNLTQRQAGNPKNTDSTPLLARLQKQYLFNQQQQPQKAHKTSRQCMVRNGDKENLANMVNSVPASHLNIDIEQYTSHNVIKIDNYEGKRFKTQQGFEPMMTRSRYMLDKQDHQNVSNAIYKSSENIVLRRDKVRKVQEKIYQSIDLTENQRPLTFGLVRKTQPMKSSLQYQEDVKIKNQILDEINCLRKSQQTLYGSKDYSAAGFADVQRCVNHHNRKAKYRLLNDADHRQEEEMIYCSKCAINLLQQGFKVEEIKQGLNRKINVNPYNATNNINMISSTGAPSRIQEMRNFQNRLSQIQTKINQSLQESCLKTNQIQEIERQIWQTQSVYDQMIEHLKKMKESQTFDLKEKKKKKLNNLQKYQKQMSLQLDSIREMKKEMREYRNKFVIMKQSQYQFLISSFLNKIQLYGNQYKEGQITEVKIQDQIDQIIIDLCQFCKNIKEIDQSRQGMIEKPNNETPNQQQEDDFICKQIKGPFRTLFPQDQKNQIKQNNMDNYGTEQEDSPSFSKQKQKPAPLPMQRSARYNQMIKNQYY